MRYQDNCNKISNNYKNNEPKSSEPKSNEPENNEDKNKLTDKDIALDMLTSSKTTITTLAKTLTETTNPQLRETLRNQLTASVNSHYRLSDITINKGWYNANTEPQQQLKQELDALNNMS